jgi:hypothetical protein
VVVAIDTPIVIHGFENVGSSVAVFVFHPSEFGTLDGVEPSISPGKPEWLVKIFGEKSPLGRFVRMRKGILDHPDLSAASANGDFPIRQKLDRSTFDYSALWSRNLGDRVVVGLLRLLGNRADMVEYET